MSATKDDILASGLQIVNARGLSALSIRAVAEDLGLSPGNVSYHFAKKEDLVAALVAQLREGNRARIEREIATLGQFLEAFHEMFRNQYEFRGLVLALPEAMASFEQLRSDYRRVEAARRHVVFVHLARLRAAGALAGTDQDLSRVVSHITFIARFWIGEAKVSYSKYSQQRVFAHYLALIADVLLPLATAPHRRELAPYRDGWLDAGAHSNGDTLPPASAPRA